MADERGRVLVVDDDADMREMLESTLGYAGFPTRASPDAMTALEELSTWQPELLVIDVMMPGIDGYGLVRLIREAGDRLPILFLSARDAVEDRVRGLRVGADDYLTKPFSIIEVVARLEALLRRADGHDTDREDGVLSAGPLTLDPGRHLVWSHSQLVHLSPTEFRLMEVLLENRDLVVSKSQLLDAIWGYDFGGDTNVVERVVANLRRKLGGGASALVTVRGFGYKAVARP